MPTLSRQAKLLIMLQALISLVVSPVLAARAMYPLAAASPPFGRLGLWGGAPATAGG